MCPRNLEGSRKNAILSTAKAVLPLAGVAYLADKIQLSESNNTLVWFGLYAALVFYEEYSSNVPSTDPVIYSAAAQPGPPKTEVPASLPSLAELGVT